MRTLALAGTRRPSPTTTRQSVCSPTLPRPSTIGVFPTTRLAGTRRPLSDLDAAIRLQPDNTFAFFFRGLSHAQLGRYAETITDLETAAELAQTAGDDDFAVTIEEALEDEAIRLRSDFAVAYYNRGVALADLGRYEKAIVDYDKAIRLRPDYAEAYNNRGVALADLGRYEKAIVDYDKAIRLRPDYAEAYNNRGVAYVDLGRYEKAIVDYDKAIRLRPDFAEAYYNRGNAHGVLGQYEKAIVDYDEAIRLRPDLAEAH